MPFTMMTDLSHAYHGVYNNPKALYIFDHEIIRVVIQSAFLSFYQLFIPSHAWFDQSTPGLTNSSNFMDYTYAIQSSLLSQQPVFLKIFLLKLPFLLFDIGVLLMLPLFFNNEKHKKFSFLFWLFNPVSLVASFVFGTADIIAVFFIMLAFYQLYKERYFFGILFLILASLSKFYALLVFPFAILFILRKTKKMSTQKRTTCCTLLAVFLAVFAWFFYRSARWILLPEIISKMAL